MPESKAVADEQAALLTAIIANPADDAARLVYADWLQEHGGGLITRAEGGYTTGAVTATTGRCSIGCGATPMLCFSTSRRCSSSTIS